MGRLQLLACVDSSAFATQPFAEEQVGAGAFQGDAAAGEPVDGLTEEVLGGRTVGQ